jgi:uncharacterized coiled-coil DUF342 family protein
VEDYEYFYGIYKEIKELKEKLDDIHTNIELAVDDIDDCIISIEDEDDKKKIAKNIKKIEQELKDLWALT